MSFPPLHEQDSCGVGFIANILGYKSHDILQKGLTALANLTHRGALSADGKTGDGAGVLTQIPVKLFEIELKVWGCEVPEEGDLAVGMIFFPLEDLARERARRRVEKIIQSHELKFFGWRKVPVQLESLGKWAMKTRPVVEQVLVGRAGALAKADFERELFLIRKEIESVAREEEWNLYVVSFSSKTLVYKALCLAPHLSDFYLDLKNPDYETAIVVYHQRFSTNTSPTWALAQPFRFLAHNGEINTISGNRNWIKAHTPDLHILRWLKDPSRLEPIIQSGGSDSASLDNTLEMFIRAGRTVLQSAAILIPEAWEGREERDPNIRAFYEYHSLFSGAWDGPASVVFSDGEIVGALLDRNGLRPARYVVTDDNLIIMGSEVGLIDLDERHILKKRRLGPGLIVAVDTVKGRLLTNLEVKKQLAETNPYRQWIDKNMMTITDFIKEEARVPELADQELHQYQQLFGYTQEEIQLIVRAMGKDGKDPVFSMGDDTPLAALSKKPRPFFDYFKQRFAQVTNPPIDPIREASLMSLKTYIGPRGNLFHEAPEHARRLKFESPILTRAEFEAACRMQETGFRTMRLAALFDVAEGGQGLELGVRELCIQAEAAVDGGTPVLILTDRVLQKEKCPMPILLAVAAVHRHLVKKGKRARASLIVETGQARDIHHFACLIGYGASVIYPYLAYETLFREISAGYLKELSPEIVEKKFREAASQGLLKIMSKMGIGAVSSYRSAQLFETLGLDVELVSSHFPLTPAQVGGVGFNELARDLSYWHKLAFEGGDPGNLIRLPLGGKYRFRRGEEYHAFNPDVVKALQAAAESGRYEDYEKYAALVNEREPTTLRDLLDFKKQKPIPLEEVESMEEIRRRFVTSSISFGALSKEAHRDLAIAMNRIGGKSGSGEGGEDPARFHPLPNGDSANSAIKQVASGRFGVTTEYLMAAQQLEIKMAQGSKPGEGGQLPGHKVSDEIARVRHAQPGVTLISPPPHHDIYSIEDLKQLIHDLKHVNPEARIIVKLVSEAGVGTIASGVAKAHADIILISGHDGGTGASPASSIKHAGSVWELGLAEAQQTLVDNDLRGRILLRVDGGMKTGRDILMAALLGAEEFGFGTAPLVAEACIMARQCHLNTCPVGVATQDEKLRAKYTGTPEKVISYLNGVAEEVRRLLAGLGAHSLNDIIGRADLLEVCSDRKSGRGVSLDLSRLLKVSNRYDRPWRRAIERNDEVREDLLDEQILKEAERAIDGKESAKLMYPIRNIDRTVGGRVAGVIAKKNGASGLPKGIILECQFLGTGGQSFGAFLMPGMRWILIGHSNDYVGKGLSGGDLVVKPAPGITFKTQNNVIIGNTVLYGATSGTLFAAGRAGERFAVRNSGAIAVVEGLGDHGCEYMTGGTVVVLGKCGHNFAAGMTGGTAYVFDPKKKLPHLINAELVNYTPLSDPHESGALKKLVLQHFEATQSAYAESLLKQWKKTLASFWKISPKLAAAAPQARQFPALKDFSKIL